MCACVYMCVSVFHKLISNQTTTNNKNPKNKNMFILVFLPPLSAIPPAPKYPVGQPGTGKKNTINKLIAKIDNATTYKQANKQKNKQTKQNNCNPNLSKRNTHTNTQKEICCE